MQKITLKILIAFMLLVPPVALYAVEEEPCYAEWPDVGTADSCVNGTGDFGSGGGGGGGTPTTDPGQQPEAAPSGLFVNTESADEITFTTAVLNGSGGNKNEATALPLTGYFRYSRSTIAPIFCNDIYGSNMKATGDSPLGITTGSPFSKQITNLFPDTTYYFCAIISDKNNIVYGGEQIVKSFKTAPYRTTVRTIGATRVSSNEATLNGEYNALSTVTIYFEYREAVSSGSTLSWSVVPGSREQKTKNSDEANVYGKFSKTVSSLDPSTSYQFRIVAETTSGRETNKVYGQPLGFRTTPTPTTTIRTNGATKVTSNSAQLNGSFNWVKSLSTYFQYRKAATTDNAATAWQTVGTQSHPSSTGVSTQKSVNFETTELEKGSGYEFRLVGETSGEGKIYGRVLSFTTLTSGGGTTIVGGTTTTIKNGTWSSSLGSGGNNGTWKVGEDSGLWTAVTGAGGTGVASWTGEGLGVGTWRSLTGSGIWVNGEPTGNQERGFWSSSLGGSGKDEYCAEYPDDEICKPVTITPTKPTTPIVDGYCTVFPEDQICQTTTTIGTGTNNNGTWSTQNGGISGSWGTGYGSGNWTATSGTGGGEIVTWSSNGDGTGTWAGVNGYGTWTTNYGNGGGPGAVGTWDNLTLGQSATPPWDAIVRHHEGIETVFARQIVNRVVFQNAYGYIPGTNLQNFAWDTAHMFARQFGYINQNRREVRVRYADRAAYQIQLEGSKLTVYEYFDEKIIDVREITTDFKNTAGYEYYFQK